MPSLPLQGAGTQRSFIRLVFNRKQPPCPSGAGPHTEKEFSPFSGSVYPHNAAIRPLIDGVVTRGLFRLVPGRVLHLDWRSCARRGMLGMWHSPPFTVCFWESIDDKV